MSSEEREPSENPPVQSDAINETDLLVEQQNVEDGSVQTTSEVVLQSRQAGLGVESSSFQDLVRPKQAGLGLESHSFLKQPNGEEGAIQANYGVVVQPSQAVLGLQSHSFEGRSFQSNWVAVQPTQAALSNLSDPVAVVMENFQHLSAEELILFEELLQVLKCSTDDHVEASYQEKEAGVIDRNTLQALPFDQNYLRNGKEDNGMALIDIQKVQNHEEGNVIHDGNALQAVLFDLRDLWPEEVDFELRDFWPDLADLEPNDFWPEPAELLELTDLWSELIDNQQVQNCEDVHDKNAIQALPPGWIELADCDGEVDTGIQAQTYSQQMLNGEEVTSIHDRKVLQTLPMDLEKVARIELLDLNEPINCEEDNDIQAQTDNGMEDNGIQARTGSKQMQDGPPQQGTAGRRLQVPVGGAKGLSESKCLSIASNEGNCLCGRMCLVQEAGPILSHAFTSNQSTLNVEGDTRGPVWDEALVSFVAESDCPDVVQQCPQDVSGSSSTPRLLSFVAESDCPDVVQQSPQDVSESSSTPRLLSLTSLVNCLQGFLGDACVLAAFATELCMGRGTGLCLFW